ncbi:MAG TPA: ROK family protein [Candidatus Hydrogenedens sp.]|nr:ROK family protein [Candidatus Hydrogenedens sp.]
MKIDWMLVKPKIAPPMDNNFIPPKLVNDGYKRKVSEVDKPEKVIIALERLNNSISRYETYILPVGHPLFESSLFYIERILKFLLWQKGGWKVYVYAPTPVVNHLTTVYSERGTRSFDYKFMGEDVYEKTFTIVHCKSENEVPLANETSQRLGRHTNGCRVGFDLGASDRKAAAVIDGEVVYTEETIWEPRKHSDPSYHYNEIITAVKTAASKMPRLDAVGGSAAGVYVNNRAMVASLFRSVPKERFGEVREMFNCMSKELGVPLVVVNDGEVTALAGSMSIGNNAVLGIAMGSSEAGGYVTPTGNITDWLNELAFAPVDYNPNAPVEEWSGDKGVGANYFSQQCVFRLAQQTGIKVPDGITDAEKLKFIQELLEQNNPEAVKIWRTMGVYLGYTLAHYSDFYDIKHVLVLGRCTSGSGGPIMMEECLKVLETEFPELREKMQVQLPDEINRRVGQSIAAASLPEIPTNNT